MLASIRCTLYINEKVSGTLFLKLESKKTLKLSDLDKSMQELRRIYKVHPEWFETPKPKSDKGKNEVDYSIK